MLLAGDADGAQPPEPAVRVPSEPVIRPQQPLPPSPQDVVLQITQKRPNLIGKDNFILQQADGAASSAGQLLPQKRPFAEVANQETPVQEKLEISIAGKDGSPFSPHEKLVLKLRAIGRPRGDGSRCYIPVIKSRNGEVRCTPTQARGYGIECNEEGKVVVGGTHGLQMKGDVGNEILWCVVQEGAEYVKRSTKPRKRPKVEQTQPRDDPEPAPSTEPSAAEPPKRPKMVLPVPQSESRPPRSLSPQPASTTRRQHQSQMQSQSPELSRQLRYLQRTLDAKDMVIAEQQALLEELFTEISRQGDSLVALQNTVVKERGLRQILVQALDEERITRERQFEALQEQIVGLGGARISRDERVISTGTEERVSEGAEKMDEAPRRDAEKSGTEAPREDAVLAVTKKPISESAEKSGNEWPPQDAGKLGHEMPTKATNLDAVLNKVEIPF